jgi:hypothetical protein
MAGNDFAKAAAVQRAQRVSRTPPGVEPGVSGKEKMFQQNRAFGPGAMKPYPFSKPPPATYEDRRTGDGVYRGGSKARPIPNARTRPQITVT